jgi:hypothetical protein
LVGDVEEAGEGVKDGDVVKDCKSP